MPFKFLMNQALNSKDYILFRKINKVNISNEKNISSQTVGVGNKPDFSRFLVSLVTRTD